MQLWCWGVWMDQGANNAERYDFAADYQKFTKLLLQDHLYLPFSDKLGHPRSGARTHH